jgi:ABC-type dipeptide/oligopeptide/nickel transport system permease subunit
MSENVNTEGKFIEEAPAVSGFKRFTRVFFSRNIVVFGLVVILVLIFSAVFAEWISPYDPYYTILTDRFIKPCLDHPLGTDYLGRDLLSRIIYGSRTSLIVGLMVIGISSMVGMTLGLIAAFFGGKIYAVIMRAIDTLMSIPSIMLSLAISSLLGGGLKNVVVAISVAMIPAYARMMCGQALSVKENDYIIASRAIGARNLRIMFRHIAPNCFPPLIVMMTMRMGRAILAEAGLSFLGASVNPPGAAWGAMVNDGYNYLFSEPLLSFFPGIAIMLTVFSFNMVGDGLRDALDPRLRGTI